MASVLYICPTYPAPDRVGLAMRAGVSLDGLARQHDVSVAVVRWADDGGSAALAWTRARATAAVLAPHLLDADSAASWLHTERGRAVAANRLPHLARRVPPAVGETIARVFGTSFDVVVVHRTYLVGAAVPFLEAGVPAILDACDDDAAAARSMARLDGREGEEVGPYEALQSTVFPWFERVLFAAVDDAAPPFGHLPNAVRIPSRWGTSAHADGLELLFVGNVGYLPNRDAVERLNRAILPAIAAMGVDAHLQRPAPDEDVTPFYERSHIAVVPLRAGAGTRIKILEAFAHGCPVVATPTAAQGLAVTDGDQLVLVSDDDRAFASAVVDLARDDGRRSRLAASARRFVVDNHDAEVVGHQLAGLVQEVADRST